MTDKTSTIISKVPFAWLYLVDDTEGTDALTLLMRFDNLSDITYKWMKSSSTTTGEKHEFTRADGAKLTMSKEVLEIDLLTGLQVASDTGGADASGLAEITLTTNAPALESASWTAFLNLLDTNYDKKILVVIGTGYSAGRTGTGSTRKADGWAYMFGKMTSDIEGSTVPMAITFAGQKASGFDLTAFTFPPADSIALERGGVGFDVATNVPTALTQTDLDALKLGKLVVKPVTP